MRGYMIFSFLMACMMLTAVGLRAADALDGPIVLDVIQQNGSFIEGFTVFILSCFVGYYVVWRVTPALHSPLMAVTNAISSVIIVGALMAAGMSEMTPSKIFGFMAVALASINIFGGFVVTGRMLHMFSQGKK